MHCLVLCIKLQQNVNGHYCFAADIDQHAAARLFEESLVTLPPLQDDRDPFEMERRMFALYLYFSFRCH